MEISGNLVASRYTYTSLVAISVSPNLGKRLGMALRKVRDQMVTEKKAKTGKVRRVKDIGGKGELNDFVIGKLQKYYAGAI